MTKAGAIVFAVVCYVLYTIWSTYLSGIPAHVENSSLEDRLRLNLRNRINEALRNHHPDITTASSPETSQQEGWLPWKREQERRKSVVKDVCQRSSPTQRESLGQLMLSPITNFKHFLVDDKRKAIYCFIPKIACTNWKRVWLVLTGHLKEKDLSKITMEALHENTNKMRIMNSTEPSDLQWKLETYKKLIIARHPFHRLASAYRDNIKEDKLFFQKQVFPWVKKRRASANATNIQWPEFVDFVTLGKVEKPIDHWSTYRSLCYPCTIDYDVIAKMETVHDDSERFLRLIGAPGDLHFPNTSRTSTKVDSSLWKDYEEDLSADQLEALYKEFKMDLKMFEYS